MVKGDVAWVDWPSVSFGRWWRFAGGVECEDKGFAATEKGENSSASEENWLKVQPDEEKKVVLLQKSGWGAGICSPRQQVLLILYDLVFAFLKS